MSTKPETAGERAKLIYRLRFYEANAINAQTAADMREAAALLAADGKAGGEVDDDELFQRAHDFGCRYDGNGCWDMPPWLDSAELRCLLTGERLPPHYAQDENGRPASTTRPQQQAAQVAQPLTEQMEAQAVRYPSPHRRSAFRDGWRSAETTHGIGKDQA